MKVNTLLTIECVVRLLLRGTGQQGEGHPRVAFWVVSAETVVSHEDADVKEGPHICVLHGGLGGYRQGHGTGSSVERSGDGGW